MLDEKTIVQLILALRKRHAVDPAGAADAVTCLRESIRTDLKAPPGEIAQTICELLEPERIGPLLCLMCNKPMHKKAEDCKVGGPF